MMIDFDHVTKEYKKSDQPALDDLTIHVDAGEFVFLTGPSGSGKSTFLKLCLREQNPTSGTVTIDGIDLTRLRRRHVPRLRRRIGTVFQDFRLLPNKTVAGNVAFALQVIAADSDVIATRVPQALDMVGLGEKGDRFPHQLSGGEQQRAAIARAIVNQPDLIIADEPTGNLDPATSSDIMDLLEYINATHATTVVMATHDAELVNKSQRRVIQMQHGRIVRDSVGDYDTVPDSSLAPPVLLPARPPATAPTRPPATSLPHAPKGR